MLTITEINTNTANTRRRIPQLKPVEDMMFRTALKAGTIIRDEREGKKVGAQKAALTRMVGDLLSMHNSNTIRKNYPTTIRKMARTGLFTEEDIEKLYMTLQRRLEIV